MKKLNKIIIAITLLATLVALCALLVACNGNKDGYSRYEGQVIRFVAPEGTPALAMLRLVTDDPTLDGTDMQYEVVSASTIVAEMNKSDVVIMPVNQGAQLIRQGIGFKLVSVAVEGSLYLVGHKETGNVITLDDLKGKRVACIGKGVAVPSLVFNYVLSANGISYINSEDVPPAQQVAVRYVDDGKQAIQLYQANKVDYIVVGEPLATIQLNAANNINAEMNLQTEYAKLTALADDNYPQAGLFVRTALAGDVKFMNALFDALERSEDWVEDHPAEVDAFAKANLYETANFPAASIPRCAIDCERLDEEERSEILTFLKNIDPKDSEGKTIDWDALKSVLF